MLSARDLSGSSPGLASDPTATTTLGTVPYQANLDVGDDADPNPDSRAATIRNPLPSSTPYMASSPTVAAAISTSPNGAVDAFTDHRTLQRFRKISQLSRQGGAVPAAGRSVDVGHRSFPGRVSAFELKSWSSGRGDMGVGGTGSVVNHLGGPGRCDRGGARAHQQSARDQ